MLVLPADAARRRNVYKRPVKKVVQEEKPTPRIEWNECAEPCLYRIFKQNIAPTTIPDCRGRVMGFAATAQKYYVLIRNFNRISDAIFTIDRHKVAVRSIWGIGTHRAAAMTREGDSFWIVSYSEKYFIRKLNTAGMAQEYHSVKALPAGTITGIGVNGGRVFFSVIEKDVSKIYLYNTATRSPVEFISMPGRVKALISEGGKLYAFQKCDDRFAKYWIVEINAEKKTQTRYRYINARIDAMAWDGEMFLFMQRKKKVESVFPAVIIPETRTVLVRPRARRITLTYNLNVRSMSPVDAGVWLALPAETTYQHIRNLEIKPEPREIVNDKWGNRWARVEWSKASGRVTVSVEFDMLNCSVAQTLANDVSQVDKGGPGALSATHAYDHGTFIVKSHMSRITATGSYYNKVMAVRDYVLDSIAFSQYSKKWGKASTYLYKGRGGVYGYCLSFIAMARGFSIPARSVGALTIDSPRRRGEQMTAHTWVQVQMPGNGWVDMDLPADMGPQKERRLRHFGFRSSRFIITFIGDFDRRDCRDRFAQKSWFLSKFPRARGSSVPWISIDRITVNAKDLTPR